MNLDRLFYKEIAEKIFNTHSPSGYCKECINLIKDILKNIGYDNAEIDNKGNLHLFIKGNSNKKLVATSSHVDTLGLMVRSIKSDGSLAVTNIGSPIIPTLDGQYCFIKTRNGKTYTGTILCKSRSSHVSKDASNLERNINNIEVRIDEKVRTADDVIKLGISNGDFIFIDPKTTFTDSGFLKSRFIDDKGGVCLLICLLKVIYESNYNLKYDTLFYFTTFEEVGHGAANLNKDIDEFVTIDMGCIGEDLSGNEYAVSIAAKDSSGPYDYELTNHLIDLAKENNINYVIDIFPFYSSDVSAFISSGANTKGALIGHGVDASHGMERVHLDGLDNTYKLIFKYLIND